MKFTDSTRLDGPQVPRIHLSWLLCVLTAGVHESLYMGAKYPHSHLNMYVESPAPIEPFPLPQYKDILWKPYLLSFYVSLQIYITL